MDERDIRLLKAIADLGTGSPEKLHEETGIPVSTIHYRLNNLREAGVIENDCYDFDLDELGLGVTVIIEVLAPYNDSYETISEKLLAIEGVTNVYFTLGEKDFVAIARVSDADKVERLVEDFNAIDEVERTFSRLVIKPLREDTRALGSYSLETLEDELIDDE
ncbi:Lrp/AsnC family transcriptional regulator [Haloarculaceae archaeon H-GB2-1]|nr:Lrp/AsnC family transcriptional regulator [Haloarculaceae archaeon H-GB1-1]MEA5388272.1 Lrp/AsnC family transcriptional regulator [Haloarculaceae archaeon H-GB11]MEA5406314.1 Lrp/AsnC family transcriptional regulator [Haloarculaceae archaeon H-GB2-1]